MRLSRAHAITDTHTHACERWLGRSYAAEHPLIDELRPRAMPAVEGATAEAILRE